MKSLPLVSLLVLIFALCGCGSKEGALAGKWKGQIAGGGQSMALGELELTADKKFKLGPAAGTWALAEDKVTLTPTSQGGPPLVLAVSSDSKTLTMVPPAGAPSGGSLTFTKE
jgi:hypothetical protein